MSMPKVVIAIGTALIFAVATQASAARASAAPASAEPACTTLTSKKDCKAETGCTWTKKTGHGKSKVAGSCS